MCRREDVLGFLLIFLIFLGTGCSNISENKEAESFNFIEWRHTGGDQGITHYSQLDQINKENVKHLKPVWTHRSGSKATVQCNPIVIGKTLYFATGLQELIALEASTGQELWRYRPKFERVKANEFEHLNRGVAYWTNGDDQTVFFTSGNLLNAVDAVSGKAVVGFGKNGQVNLNEGHHLPPNRMGITSSASPVVFKNLVIIGCSTWAAGSNVSAYDAITGERVWKFNTLPHAGEFGHDTYSDPDYWLRGAGVNVWGGMSVDEENEMLFFGTGQPKFDFYRPNNAGEHLFGNSVVALNINTGKRIWHYQVIHHDLWDLDVPCAPILSSLKIKGEEKQVAIQTTKTGNTFIFDRITGELYSEVTEEPVPPSTLARESAFPTQPIVHWPEPFSKQQVTLEDVTNLTVEDSLHALERIRNADIRKYAPPSEKGIIYYGLHGGGEWGGGAYDPENSILYINSNDVAWHIEMIDANKDNSSTLHPGRLVYMKKACVSCHGANLEGMENIPPLQNIKLKYGREEIKAIVTEGRGAMPAMPGLTEKEIASLLNYLTDVSEKPFEINTNTYPNYVVKGYNRFLDSRGYPATKPPWGTLNALDLKSGKILWKVPLGTYQELLDEGIPPTGSENFGGPLVTKSGLVFIGATSDEKFRAFDAETGNLLWEYQLPYGAYATPSTYIIDGKQYIVIAAGGGGKPGTKAGDAIIAFAIPN